MNTIDKRQTKEKELLLEQFRKTPIVQIACEKLGVGRATYYRWRKENQEFAQKADIALEDGNKLVNDMAEAQIISAIRDKNMTAILFWLKSHHPSYATRVEVTAGVKKDEPLTEDQAELIKKSLIMAGIIQTTQNDKHTE